MRQIKSIEELKKAAKDKQVEGFIRLNYGAKSSKSIEYKSDIKKFWVHNDIDGSEQHLTAKELSTKSNIAEAISKGAFYLYG